MVVSAGAGVLAASAPPAHRAQAGAALPPSRSAFILAAGANVLLSVNRVSCNLTAIGEMCVDAGGSPVYPGGFWPRGTPDGYVFNGGIQVAALIPGDRAQFAWAGDTVGAFFVSMRGDVGHSVALGSIVSSLDPTRARHWPTAARVLDPALFDGSLLGRHAASEQDTWVRYWDNSGRRTGRAHPMGILVEQRSLAWRYPSGNEDIVYFIYRLTNVTARDRARYDGLAAAGYGTAEIDAIAALGATFHDSAAADSVPVTVPDSGIVYDSVFVAVVQDPDIANAGNNLSSAVLPFQLALAYDWRFSAGLDWQFPADVFFYPPFAQAPGFVALKLLGTPPDPLTGAPSALRLYSTTGKLPVPAPPTVQGLWRQLSGHLLPADGFCSVSDPIGRHVCGQRQFPNDTKHFLSAGPFRLRPGESAVFAVALIFAPAIDSIVRPFFSRGMAPGLPTDGALLAAGRDTLKNVDRAAGWVSHADRNGDGVIGPTEVVTVPGSLLSKAQLAQAVFDHRFLVPTPPEAPLFFLVPGDQKVTVVWQKSASEDGGDPFFAAAADVTSSLYDPDFRLYDVEGYRIWRGRTPQTMQLVAQFDYRGTAFSDYTGQFLGRDYGLACAPELGVTSSCPGFPNPVALAGPIIQVPIGGRVLLRNGAVLTLRTDTAVTGGASGLPPLADTNVPFAFEDRGLQNAVPYYYAVTAFDVNSLRSGPSSFESASVVKSATPRIPSSNLKAAVFATALVGDDGVELDPAAPMPGMLVQTGTFLSPMPPANGATLELLAPVLEAMRPGDYLVRMDSVSAGFAQDVVPGPPPPTMYLSIIGPDTARRALPYSFRATRSLPDSVVIETALVPFDSAQTRRLGLGLTRTDARMMVRYTTSIPPLSESSTGVSTAAGRFGLASAASRFLAHSRWFDESSAERADPTISPFADSARHAGKLTGVGRIYSPSAYRQPIEGEFPNAPAQVVRTRFRSFAYAQVAWYPADFTVTWGSGGSVTVRDVTHHVDLPFTPFLTTGYGFVNAAAFAAAGVTGSQMISADGLTAAASGVAYDPSVVGYRHLYFLTPVCGDRAAPCVPMQRAAATQPLDFNNDGTPDGTGIVLVINGEPFLMEMGSLPQPGKKWRLRAVGGSIRATCTPTLPSAGSLTTAPAYCSAYEFTRGTPRPAYAPGLALRLRVTRPLALDTTVVPDLSLVHTVPDPYYLGTSLDAASSTQQLRFVNLPDRAIIRIYSASGILVAMVSHNEPGGGGEATWDLTSRNGHRVASGVYFYHVEVPGGRARVGRLTVVNGRR